MFISQIKRSSERLYNLDQGDTAKKSILVFQRPCSSWYTKLIPHFKVSKKQFLNWIKRPFWRRVIHYFECLLLWNTTSPDINEPVKGHAKVCIAAHCSFSRDKWTEACYVIRPKVRQKFANKASRHSQQCRKWL